jgi:hypothetical protein
MLLGPGVVRPDQVPRHRRRSPLIVPCHHGGASVVSPFLPKPPKLGPLDAGILLHPFPNTVSSAHRQSAGSYSYSRHGEQAPLFRLLDH